MSRHLTGFLLLAFVATGWGLMDLSERYTWNAESIQLKKRTRNEKDRFVKERWKYEIEILKDPVTGKIPYNIRERELAFARLLPEKSGRLSGIQSVANLNTYLPAGPTNIGGRTRAIAYDRRFDNSSNRVIISGCVSGGILRSADGGASWTLVTPQNDIHALTALAQDPRPGFENTWYAGGGEAYGNTASASGAPYLGHGVWKSTDNGVTWQKLPFAIQGVPAASELEAFDHPFDFVHNIAVNPTNGHVFIAGHRRLIRSTDGGATWTVAFEGSSAANSATGQLDVISLSSGRLFLGVNGGFPDVDRRGVWTSTNGTTWTRVAGGPTLNQDSVANWRGSDPAGNSRRILLASAPSNQNIVYVIYENGLSQDGSDPKPEIDMFKLDMSSGFTWTNLSANMPDFPGQMDVVDPLDTQDGYNMMVVVKPDDENTVFVGGTNLFRSTSGFTNTTATAWIGGYGQDFPSGLSVYPNSHADMHNLVFMPDNNNSNPGYLRAICANDGGLQTTVNIMATGAVAPVNWGMVPNYQTLQYYYVAMDPAPGQNNFIGGAQDNGTQLRIEDSNPNEQIRIISGDGGAAAIASVTSTAFTFYGSLQFGEIYRDKTNQFVKIKPNNLTQFPGIPEAFGEFVTYYKLDFDNTEDLYYVNFNRLFRTKSASTVTSGDWDELTGVRSAVNPTNPASGTNVAIRSLELSRGAYFPSHVLYIGTSNGRLFRLDDPRNTPAATAPVNITPSGMTGSVSDIAVNPNNDEEVMVVVSNYNTVSIWWTNNAKSATPTWRNAEGTLTLPSIRSCMILVKKDASNNPITEYYVGTSVGLYSAVNIGPTLQGNNTVTWVREGGNVLNYSVISSLDYRPQDNSMVVGTHGNGMYYTSIGAPDFRPNQNTGINDPVRNDKNFIDRAFPTLVRNSLEYRIGNMFTVKRMVIRVQNLAGQTVVQKETAYQNGSLSLLHLPKGAYVLSITSSDYSQQYIRKFVKE